ncbi:MAG: hypothetical protein QOH79_3147 [Acidimicrobiaceae bacterium]
MKSTFRRAIAGFSLVALISVIAASPSNAADAPTGVGSARGSTSLVVVDYGTILNATVLHESNTATLDPLVSVPAATETLTALSGHTDLLGDFSSPSVQTSSTGAADQKNTAFDLSSLGAPGVTGQLTPISLSSLVDATGAQSSATAALVDLNAIGVLGVDSASAALSGLASPTSSVANRSVTANSITVLDLQALLNMVGLDVGDLSLEQIVDLLDQLDEVGMVESITHLTGTDSAADLADKLGQLSSGITSAEDTLGAANTALAIAQTVHTAAIAVCNLIADPTAKQLCIDTADAALNAAQDTVDSAQDALDLLQGLLNQLLQAMLDVLAGTPLLAIDGVTAGAVATAADTVGHSSAVVTGTINDIRVGGIDLGAIDANTTLDEIETIGTQVAGTINGILGSLAPSLGNLISIELFNRFTSVAKPADYVNAIAGITALALTITPPDLCDVFDEVFGNEIVILPVGVDVTIPDSPVSDVLAGAGSIFDITSCFEQALSVHGLRSAAFGDDEDAPIVLGEGEVAALTEPFTVAAASAGSASNFKVVAVPATTPETPALPRTGTNETLLLMFGGLMAAVALGLRRVSAPVRVRANRKQ